MKTCLIIAGGYMFFVDMNTIESAVFIKNVIGVSVAMAGVFGYTYFKLQGK